MLDLPQAKRCKSCGQVKDLSEFYAHPQMRDGHLNTCKDCKRRYVKLHAQTPEGKANERRRSEKPSRRSYISANAKRWKLANPEKRRAEEKLNNAVRDGKLQKPRICEGCYTEHKHLHAHHHDYSKPLDVTWLCPSCHGKHNPSFIPF